MSYIYLLLSVLANGVKGYSSKKASNYIDTSLDNAKLNALRAPLCALFSIIILSSNNQLSHLSDGGIHIAALSGIAMAIFQMAWISSVKSGAYMMVGAFGTASFIIPFILGFLCLNEEIGLKKIFAVIFTVIAVYFMCCYNVKINGTFTVKTFLSLLAITVFQGTAQFLQKYYMATVPNANQAAYNFYMFVFMGVFLLVYMCLSYRKSTKTHPLKKQLYLYVIIMSAALFIMSYMQALAAKTMAASVLYPLINVLSLFLNFFMSTVIFKEKIKRENIIGVVMIFISILLYL